MTECFVCFSEIDLEQYGPDVEDFVLDTCAFHRAHFECAYAWFSIPANNTPENLRCPMCRTKLKPPVVKKLGKCYQTLEQRFRKALRENSVLPLHLNSAIPINMLFSTWLEFVKIALVSKATRLLEVLKDISYAQYDFSQRREVILYLYSRPLTEMFMWISNGKFSYDHGFGRRWPSHLLNYCQEHMLQDEFFQIYVQFNMRMFISEREKYGRWILSQHMTNRDERVRIANLPLYWAPRGVQNPACVNDFYHFYLLIDKLPYMREYFFEKVMLPCSIDAGNKVATTFFCENASGYIKFHKTAINYCIKTKNAEMLKHVFDVADKTKLQFSYPKLAKMMVDPEIFTEEMKQIVLDNHRFSNRPLFDNIKAVTEGMRKLFKKPVR